MVHQNVTVAAMAAIDEAAGASLAINQKYPQASVAGA
jgi:hypothetical protein